MKLDEADDGCRVLVAPFEAAETIESDAIDGRDDAWSALANVHVHEVVDLQCLLAGEDPRAPAVPRATRYNPFTRSHQTVTRGDALLATWRGLVGGEWRSHAEMTKMAEEGSMQGFGAIVFVVPDALIDALTRATDPNELAKRWCSALSDDDVRCCEAALAMLARAAHDAKESRKSVFLVELI